MVVRRWRDKRRAPRQHADSRHSVGAHSHTQVDIFHAFGYAFGYASRLCRGNYRPTADDGSFAERPPVHFLLRAELRNNAAIDDRKGRCRLSKFRGLERAYVALVVKSEAQTSRLSIFLLSGCIPIPFGAGN